MIQLIIRLVCAYLYSRWFTKTTAHLDKKVAVIIPTYNEGPFFLMKAIRSVLAQRHTNLEIVVVDDGSFYPVAKEPFMEEFFKLPNFKLITTNNQGKSLAQVTAIQAVSQECEFIFTMDSDTRLNADVITNLLTQFDDKTGAVCGQVTLARPRGLNRLVQYLYWNAFNIWRAGSSAFGQVAVCSGAATMYRKQALRREVLDAYVKRGVEVGNDRYMTFLILKEGWLTRYDDTSIAVTIGPVGLKFIHQQIRWNKSFWLGLVYSWRLYSFKLWYFTFDMLLKAISRLLNMALFVWCLVLLSRGNWETFGWVMFVTFCYGLIHSVAGAVITRKPQFLLFALWANLSVFLVAPINIWAILTFWRDKWGTR